jgi:patatin-like phospholipase/acyl hydrolase
MKNQKRVLTISIDGGGILGIGPLYYMTKIEQFYGKKISDLAVGFAGTSTGAIIASLLAEGYSAHEIYDLYKSQAKNIFDSYPWYKRLQPSCPKYNNEKYIKILKDKLKGNMGDFKKPVFFPACCTNALSMEKVFGRDDVSVPKWLAVQASSAAPTYFSPAGTQKNYIDGGLFFNNPAAVLQAGMMNTEFKDKIKILSFGTGMSTPNTATGDRSLLGWGKYLIEDWLVKSGESSTYVAKKNLGDENVKRLLPITGKSFNLDSIDKMDQIEDVWEQYFNDTWNDVKEFLK